MYHNLPRLLKLIVLIAVLTTFILAQAVPAFAVSAETVPSWAASEIQAWKDLGLLQGDQNGLVHPNTNLTRAEFFTFVNRVFNFTEQSSTAFTDVPENAWYASEISKAYAAGITSGVGNGKMAPLEPITREEVASILSRAFSVTEDTTSGSTFPDDVQISSWAREAAYAMRDENYISGDTSGAFMPKKDATRAEVIKMINNVMGQLITSGGTYSGISGRNVVVNTAGVTISDLDITGNLYITCGAGQGSLNLQNAKITGTMFVSGGGSVGVEGSAVGEMVIDGQNDDVQVTLNGTTVSGDVSVGSQANVELTGSSSISRLSISSGAAGSAVNLGSGSVLQNFIADAKVNVIGSGSISNAVINANNVSIAQTPANMTLNADSVIIAGKAITGSGSESTSSSGSSGGHHSDDDSKTSNETDLYDYATVLSSFSNTGAQSQVKQYIEFLQDSTYTPSIANTATDLPSFTNAITFVNKDFTVHPSLFAALRDVNTSVLDSTQSNLWIGTDTGVTKIKLSDNSKTVYDTSKDLKDNKVLLLISDGGTGVYAITQTGVSHIKI